MSATVGYATLQIIPSAKGFTKNLRNETEGPMEKTGRKSGTLFAGGFGKALPAIGTALAAVGIGSFLKSAVGGATDLNESISKTGVIFGQEALPGLEKFAETAATSMGQTKQEALDALSTFAIFGKGAGLQGKGLQDFSTDLATLSGDLASFYNASGEDVNTAIGAALRGETEGIRKYGVLLDATTLQNRAFAMGLIKSKDEALTPQTRALAAQAEILAQTGDAQGDFARTSGGLANQQRILSASFSNLKTKIGSVLLPIVLSVVSFLNRSMVPAFERLGPLFSRVGDWLTNAFRDATTILQPLIEKITNAFRESLPTIIAIGQYLAASFTAALPVARALFVAVVAVFGWIIDNRAAVLAFAGTILAIRGAMALWTLATKIHTAVMAAWNAVLYANPVTLVIVAIAALVAVMVYAYQRSETFRKVVRGAFEGVKIAVFYAVAAVVKYLRFFLNVHLSVAGGILTAMASAFGWIPGLGDKLKRADNAFRGMKDKILGTLEDFGNKAAEKGAAGAANFSNAIQDGAPGAEKAGRAVGAAARRGIEDGFDVRTESQEFQGRRPGNGVNMSPVAPKIAPIKPPKIAPIGGGGSSSGGGGGATEKSAKSAGKTLAQRVADAIGDGFRSSISRGSAASITKAFRTLERLVEKTSIKSDDRIVATAKARLVQRAKQLAGIAEERLRLTKAIALGTSAAAAALEAGAIGNFDLNADNGPKGFAAIQAGMTKAIENAKQFAAAIGRLKKAGLNSTTLSQIIAAGPEKGLAQASAILESNGVGTVNALQKQLVTASAGVGDAASTAFYGVGVQTAKGLVKGLDAEAKKIEGAMTRIANAMVKAIKKALGIKSPSRVMASLGKFSALGFAQGVDDNAAVAQKALTRATAPPSPSSLSAPGSPSVASRNAAQPTPVTVPIHLDGRVLAEAVFEIGGSTLASGRV